MNCIPMTLQQQMHNFGDIIVAKPRASGVPDQIKVNPSAKSSRKSKVPVLSPWKTTKHYQEGTPNSKKKCVFTLSYI